ncbi:MAG TPA: SDR family NAD(P)-dependent oxidoreductase [Candidatus Acidoferrales bacterium]|nr:SDR family NAD(P)-dependent oxidoreductase [Candidatus Acidoferrales bacterium]
MQLANKVVWITGASAGIGEALANRVAREGALLALSARRRDELERVKASLPQGTRAAIVPGDVTDLASIPKWIAQIESELGPIDVLVNNAGVSQRSLARDTAMETYRLIMEVDFFAPVALTQAVVPAMVERGSGQIVVTSSVAGKYGTPLRTGYAAAKHALHGYFDSLRAEVAKDGVVVTALVVGAVHTDVSINALTGDGSSYGIMDDLQSTGIEPERAADLLVAGIIADEPEVLVAEGISLDAYELSRKDPKALYAAFRMK